MRSVLNAPIHRIGHDVVTPAPVGTEGFGHQQIDVLCNAFEPTVGNQQTRHRSAVPVVVVRLAVSVNEVFPAGEIDVLEVAVVECNARVHDACGHARTGQVFRGWMNQIVVQRVTLEGNFTGPQKNGSIAEHHGCKVAGSEDKRDAHGDADDDPNGAEVGGFLCDERRHRLTGWLNPSLWTSGWCVLGRH